MQLSDSETRRWHDLAEEAFREDRRSAATIDARATSPASAADIRDADGQLLEMWPVNEHAPGSPAAHRQAMHEIAVGDDAFRDGARAHAVAVAAPDATTRDANIDQAHHAYYEAADRYVHAASLYHAGLRQHIDSEAPPNTAGLPEPLRQEMSETLRRLTDIPDVGPVYARDPEALTRAQQITADLRTSLERATPELFVDRGHPLREASAAPDRPSGAPRADAVRQRPGDSVPDRLASLADNRPNRATPPATPEPRTSAALRAAQDEITRGDAHLALRVSDHARQAIDHYLTAASLYYTGHPGAHPLGSGPGVEPLPDPVRTDLAHSLRDMTTRLEMADTTHERDYEHIRFATEIRERLQYAAPDLVVDDREPPFRPPPGREGPSLDR